MIRYYFAAVHGHVERSDSTEQEASGKNAPRCQRHQFHRYAHPFLPGLETSHMKKASYLLLVALGLTGSLFLRSIQASQGGSQIKAKKDPCSGLYREEYIDPASEHIKALWDRETFRAVNDIYSWMDSQEPGLLLQVVLNYLDSALADKDCTKSLKKRLKRFRATFCEYEKYKVPENSLDFDTLAEYLGFRFKLDQQELELLPALYPDGSPIKDLAAFFYHRPDIMVHSYLQIYLRKSALYTLYDQSFIDRLNLVLKALKKLSGDINAPVLELGAGRGDIARALRRNGHDVTAIDNFSEEYLSQTPDPENKFHVIRSDLFQERERWNDYNVLYTFLPPNPLTVVTYYRQGDYGTGLYLRKRFILAIGRWRGSGGEELIRIATDSINHYITLELPFKNFPVPSVYGGEALEPYVFISDFDSNEDDLKARGARYVRALQKMDDELQKLLEAGQ